MTRFVFLDAPHGGGWHATGALAELSAVAGLLAERGHRVSVAAFAHWNLGHEHWPAQVERAIIPLIERPAIEVANGGLGNGRPAYDALCVAQWLEEIGFDVVIAPEAGGLAAYSAMAAAASPDGAGAKTVLWATGGTRARLLADRRPARFADLVGDALEHAALKAANAVIAPLGSTPATGRKRLALPVPPLPAEVPGRPERHTGINDIALIGGLEEAGGALGFLDAIEKLQGRGLMAGRSITIAGPARREGRGLSAATVEVRARNWTFPWSLKPDLSARDTLGLMADPQRLSVFAGAEAGFPGLLAAAIEAGAAALVPRTRLTRALLRPDRQKDCLYGPAPGGLDRAIEPLLNGRSAAAPRLARTGTEAVTAWADELESLAAPDRPRRSRGHRSAPAISVCVICREHPRLLPRALASIEAGSYGGKVEIVLVDDAATPAAAQVIDRHSPLSGTSNRLKIIRNDVPMYPSAARNQAAGEASGDCLVFLDDDNWLLDDGLARLASAMASGAYDVVTAALAVDQPGADDGRPPLRMAFLGDAGLAGLIYNGFGDASLIIRKQAFERAGGFPDEGVLTPAEDWVFLARCRAAGLRMASLWKPCFGYHKPVDLAQTRWRKSHKEGALARVREAYGRLEGDDLALALAYLQGLELARQEES